MKSIIIYGTGSLGRKILSDIQKNCGGGGKNVLFTDPRREIQGNIIDGALVISPEEILNYDCEKVVIASTMVLPDIVDELINKHGVPKSMIDIHYSELLYHKNAGARIRWLEKFAEVANFRGYDDGNCAEVGVFNGSFAKHINRCFPNKKLYLFDTFEGFDVRDVEVEKDKNLAAGWNIGGFKSFVRIDEILGRMIQPDNVIFKVGFFPDTAVDVDDTFTFVNLDVDLYAPTLAGLEFFYPRMVKGGVILIHDYFPGLAELLNGEFVGIRQAVEEFSAKHGIPYMPIGDMMSVAFIRE